MSYKVIDGDKYDARWDGNVVVGLKLKTADNTRRVNSLCLILNLL